MLKMRILDVPCGIAELGSQMRDDSIQCRLVGRSAHMFQKTKTKKNHIPMYSISLYGKSNASLGTDLTWFSDFGKLTAENNCRSTCKPISDRL